MSALEEAGYSYSSSTHPIKHDLYGIPEQPRFAFYPFSNSSFVEIPVTTMRLFGRNWPAGGGGYFRLFPYALFKQNLKIVQRRDQKPCTFYFHPWEIDPEQPKICGHICQDPVSALSEPGSHLWPASEIAPGLSLVQHRFGVPDRRRFITMPRNILFLSHRLPYPPNKGDKIRSYALLKHLASLGTVHLGCFVDDPKRSCAS